MIELNGVVPFYGECEEVYERSGALYHLFKNSDMTLEAYLREDAAICPEFEKAMICYPNLIRFRKGIRAALWHEAEEYREAYVKKQIRHEGMHGRDARRISKRLGFSVTYRYGLIVLSSGRECDEQGTFGVLPVTDFPHIVDEVGQSKEMYIAFYDALFLVHEDPSEGDKIMQKYV